MHYKRQVVQQYSEAADEKPKTFLFGIISRKRRLTHSLPYARSHARRHPLTLLVNWLESYGLGESFFRSIPWNIYDFLHNYFTLVNKIEMDTRA